MPHNQNFKVWLQKWKKVYIECKEQALPKIDGNYLVTDFAYAVESITPVWSDFWKNQCEMLKWEKKTFPTFFELVEIY